MGRRSGEGSVVAMIPARLGSTRFPRKALADETGTALVVHVCRAAAVAERVGRVVVATDSEDIAQVARGEGFEAVMTGEHPNGTSRLVEASDRLGLDATETVVNVQGDEPEIEAGVIDAAVLALQTPLGGQTGAVGPVVSPIRSVEEAENPNVVKAALGVLEGETGVARAMYFSRATIPFDRDGTGDARRFRHVGLYAYTVSVLRRYPGMGETPCEASERLEQLRWLEQGLTIHAAVREASHAGIDTPEQYRAFVERWRGRGA
ncbi:MAG: 3-deoxy-manno-octulosonate cytidylyltransferase [Phycisphaerales bacterium JB059]